MNLDNILNMLMENTNPLSTPTSLEVGDIFVIPYSNENPSIEPYQIIEITNGQLLLSLIELEDIGLNRFKPIKDSFLKGSYSKTVKVSKPNNINQFKIEGLTAYRHYTNKFYYMGA